MAPLLLATGLLLALSVAPAHGLPPRRAREDSPDNFVAVGTNRLATNVLQSYVDVDANIAFSPLGVSALLAILAEGARGETRNQLVAALALPADREKVREAYKTVLSRLKAKHTLNNPEFRNWFYIYKNYTVEQCFRDVLEENYLTEVRDVDNPHNDAASEQSVETSTVDVIVHKPIKIEHEGVKVVLPEVPEVPDVPEVQAEEENELEKVEVVEKVVHAVKGEGLDPDNLPADLHPMSQVPINPLSLDKEMQDMKVINSPTKNSQEDAIRTIMVQEAVVMEEALKNEDEQNKTATMEFVKEREQEIVAVLEKDVVNKEQIKVSMEEQIQTEEEIQNAIKEKVEQQEEVKGALETDMKKEEEVIAALAEDIASAEAAKSTTEPEPASVVPDMMDGGQIKVAVVVMNDEEVKEDEAVPLVVQEPSTTEKEEASSEMPPPASTNTCDHTETEEKVVSSATTEEVPVAVTKEPEEEMMAIERKVRSTEEVTSSFSGNNLVSKASTNKKVTSKMIAFNALYFKGSWKTPFVTQPTEGTHSFYTSETDELRVPMMHSEGSFNIGKIAALDSVAIDLPYEGGRYSLLLILPNSRSGLKKLIGDLSGYSLCDLSKTLTSQHVEVCLPSFEVQTTTKPMRALEKFGVNHIFSKETADLSGISPSDGLFVQDMSQLVILNVDLTSSSTNFLTGTFGQASNEAARTSGDAEKFVADHPFLFFVHDVVDNIIVVAGKVTNPTTAPDDYKEL